MESELHKALLSIAKGEAVVFSTSESGLHVEVVRDRYIRIEKIISPIAAEHAQWDIIAQHVNDGLKSVRDFDPTPDASGGWPVPKWMESQITGKGA